MSGLFLLPLCSEGFRHLWKFLDIFGNLWICLCCLQKTWHSLDKTFHTFIGIAFRVTEKPYLKGWACRISCLRPFRFLVTFPRPKLWNKIITVGNGFNESRDSQMDASRVQLVTCICYSLCCSKKKIWKRKRKNWLILTLEQNVLTNECTQNTHNNSFQFFRIFYVTMFW